MYQAEVFVLFTPLEFQGCHCTNLKIEKQEEAFQVLNAISKEPEAMDDASPDFYPEKENVQIPFKSKVHSTSADSDSGLTWRRESTEKGVRGNTQSEMEFSRGRGGENGD